ncbi:MAG TPA: agmatinase [Nannocystaceae bacterium]|nr:agmatinase [Nannocystaceae bacterium]
MTTSSPACVTGSCIRRDKSIAAIEFTCVSHSRLVIAIRPRHRTLAMDQQPFETYVRHGLTPFFRLPPADAARLGHDIYAGCDAALLGVPYDSGTTYRSGARLASYHIRRVSALVAGFHPIHRIDVFDQLAARDCGNVMAPPFNAAAMRELVNAEIAAVLDAGATPFVIGGDHSVSLPVLRALAKHHGPVALVHVDAHFDCSTAEGWGEKFHHGTPIRNAIEEGLLAEGKVVQIGLRGPWSASSDGDLAEAFGGMRLTADELANVGATNAAKRIVELVGDAPTYISIDIDAVDPAFAPGTGTPIPGGLTARELLGLLRGLAGVQLCGFDLVEVTPMLDHADVTCLLAAHALFEGLALAAIARAA